MNPKILEYCAVEAKSVADLESAVNNMIESGYQPFGSIAVAQESEDQYPIFAQAMVTYEDAEVKDSGEAKG